MASPFVMLDVEGFDVKVTNPEKVYFGGVARGTKLDLVQHYLSVGAGIVRTLLERPTYLKRHPDGAETDPIYQKRVPEHRPEWIETVRVSFPSGRHADALCVTKLADVAWCANLGCIDFHPWPSRRADTELPDELRIDLDPQPGTSFEDARLIASTTVQEVLTELGWVGFPKTSGNRGVHVYVRIEPRWGFTEVRRAALALAREVERRRPDLVTTKWWKEERGERLFVDYNQNARDRTIASAYSVRALHRGTVSTPVTWGELPSVDVLDFTLDTVGGRFALVGDLWASMDDVHHDITPLLEWAERDERDRGLGDAPYPPNFPKMEGEPKRVQPSRDKDRPRE